MSAPLSGVSLTWLFDGIAALPANDARVSDLTMDSREARAGCLFLALPGRGAHGVSFAADALARGATVVLWDPEGLPAGSPSPAAGVLTANSAALLAPVAGLRHLAGRIADRFFGQPSAQLRVVGITGTNGKTTCAYLLAQCLGRLASDAAYAGTIGWGRIGALQTATGNREAHTTPDVVSVHRRLATLRALGVRDVAMEVSSHALDQGRVDGVRWHSAAFTNLTRDHLDYHPTLEAYGAAKSRLFDAADLQHVVINVGNAFGRELARRHRGRVPLTAVWVGEEGAGWVAAGSPAHRSQSAAEDGAEWIAAGSPAHRSQQPAEDGAEWIAAGSPAHRSQQPAEDGAEWVTAGWAAHRWLQATEVVPDVSGLSMTLADGGVRHRLTTRLLGRFNAENAVIVIACLAGLGVPLDDAAAALAECTAPPGRMEVIDTAGPDRPLAVVDYAHTPDALAKALRALREHCRGALWCVFGCGGDRDPGKRPLMGRIADELADQIIVTDDNPRSEDPQAIIFAIADAITVHRARLIPDRGAAIAAALNDAGPDDAVLIAGKGHEDYQIYGSVRRSFSDRHEALRHLRAGAGVSGERP